MAQFTIRIPDELRDRIKAAAAEDKRSVNRQIEEAIEQSLVMRKVIKTAQWLNERKESGQ